MSVVILDFAEGLRPSLEFSSTSWIHEHYIKKAYKTKVYLTEFSLGREKGAGFGG